jgi:enoyl-CoA hydratase/carnithine racemase
MQDVAVSVATENVVLYQSDKSIAYITINRPKVLNALNRRVFAELRAALERAQNDPAVRGVIITGSGEKAFIAGEDISELAGVSAVEAASSTRSGQAVLDLIEDLGKPVIAAVNGFALGGGCEAALACTIRLASESSKFGLPEVKLGIIPGYGGTQRLPRLVGKGVAMQLILSGAMIDAAEAHRVGLVNEVLPGPELIGRAEAILNQIGANAPLSIKYASEAINKGMETSLAEGLVLESTFVAICTSTEDKKEGTTAFLEKRAANFNGH